MRVAKHKVQKNVIQSNFSRSKADGWFYHGYFELVLESVTKNPIAADIIIYGIISGDFLDYIKMVCCVYSLELPR